MINETIKGNETENNKILSFMFAQEIIKARDAKSLRNILKDLNIEVLK